MSTLIPVERLWELYDYSPFTGALISKFTGERLQGRIHPEGYRLMTVWHNKQNIQVRHSRVVYAWCTGAWPIHQVDHNDRNRLNDRIHNLIPATNRENSHNKSTFQGGATYEKRRQKWRAQIRIEGKRKHLGYHSTQAEAQQAYKDALNALEAP